MYEISCYMAFKIVYTYKRKTYNELDANVACMIKYIKHTS